MKRLAFTLLTVSALCAVSAPAGAQRLIASLSNHRVMVTSSFTGADLVLFGAIETPTTGHVLLEGVDVATLNDTERTLIRRRRIGFIFQAFNLLPTLSAIENVALPLELDGISESAARERAYGALELVDLAKRHDHVPSMMSGGEQQRVAVARALVIEPAIVLADEPTGNLDSVNSAAVMRLLRDLVETRGHTVIIVTHDNDIAAQADRTVHVRDGKLEDGDVLHMRRPAKQVGIRK